VVVRPLRQQQRASVAHPELHPRAFKQEGTSWISGLARRAPVLRVGRSLVSWCGQASRGVSSSARKSSLSTTPSKPRKEKDSPLVSVGSGRVPSNIGCNCKKTRCLKLYAPLAPWSA
jgi:hypothetical protein